MNVRETLLLRVAGKYLIYTRFNQCFEEVLRKFLKTRKVHLTR